MEEVTIKGMTFEPYLRKEEIAKQVKRVAAEIKRDCADKNPVFLCVLTGAFVFAADLYRACNIHESEVAFIRFKSYEGTQTTGSAKQVMGLSEDIAGRTVIIADIVLAAVDTTQRPVVYVNGQRLANNKGHYEVGTGKAGTYDYSGWIEVMGRDGTLTRRDFKSSYTVIDPVATISATMMNVLYAGINNPISIGVPGVPASSISASMTNGSLVKSGDGWVAHPTKVGAECVITVTAEMDGQRMNVGSTTFRVRKLPDPMPFIAYRDAKGNVNRYKGGRGFSKGLLLAASGVDAAIDDDILNIDYRVASFETVFFDSMGNAMPEVSAGSRFSERQLQAIRRLQRGKRFYITRVKAVGPDGITRDIAPMEVIVN